MSSSPPCSFAIRLAGILVWMACVGGLACGQVPNTLRHSLFAPKTLPQEFEQQGHSVAIAGTVAVVGVPLHDTDDVTGLDCGVVKVHNALTGDLLHLLKNPDVAPFGYFGQAVAISGTKVVVGSGSTVEGFAYAGRVHVFDLASPTPTVPVLTLDNPAPAAYDDFGHSVAVDGNRVVVGAWLDDTGESNAGCAYVYDLTSPTPAVPVQTLANPGPGEDDNFGVAVAVSGARVVVGAYRDDTIGAPNAGRVYFFDMDSTTPDQPVLSLDRPGAQENDQFGTAVAISGTKVVVGIETADVGSSNSGSAAVFDLLSSTPEVPVGILQNPAPAENAYFGTAVSISGNLVTVGEYRNSVPAGNGGACHVFDLASGTPTVATTTLRKPVPVEADYFGNAVAISGTVVLVGAWHDDSGDDETGSSYVFNLSSGTPGTPVAILNNPAGNSADRYGAAVAISGDFVVVGSPESDAGATGAGRVSVFDLASTNPTAALHDLENPSPAADDGFGGAIAISGSKVIVGAAGDDGGAADAGTAYVYDLSSPTPDVPVLVIPNPSPASGDGFGKAVAISGTTCVVGAEMDDEGAANAGRAYVFNLSGATPSVPVTVLSNPSPAADDRFGGSVGASGTRAVVGASGDDATATDAGIAYVYELASGTPSVPAFTLNKPSPQIGDAFGCAVAISANRVVVGASGDDANATNAGRAYAYDLSSGTPTVPTVELYSPAPVAEDGFGNAVAIADARVVVGVMLANSPTDSGRVYSFNLASGTPTVPSATLVKQTPSSGDQFGASVGVVGSIIVVGTPSDNKTATDKGAAYVFGPAAPEIAITGPSGAELSGGDLAEFGAVAMGAGGGGTMTFSILNTGITSLAITQVSVSGGDAADFSINTTGMTSNVAADDDTNFSVILNPSLPGNRTTTLRIESSDADESPFDIQLSGWSLSPDHDTDGDGLNDVAELRMATLGFDWQTADPALVQAFQETASGAGLFSPDQVQSLRVKTPAISRNPATGKITLSLNLEKAATPSLYLPFPMSVPQTTINPQGELEFEFTVADDAAFFRLETE